MQLTDQQLQQWKNGIPAEIHKDISKQITVLQSACVCVKKRAPHRLATDDGQLAFLATTLNKFSSRIPRGIAPTQDDVLVVRRHDCKSSPGVPSLRNEACEPAARMHLLPRKAGPKAKCLAGSLHAQHVSCPEVFCGALPMPRLRQPHAASHAGLLHYITMALLCSFKGRASLSKNARSCFD